MADRTSGRERLLAFARRYLPQGGTLSEERWWKRHRGVLGLLWGHAIVIPIYALIRGLDPVHVVLESLVLPIAALAASSKRSPRRARTFAAAAGLLMSSGLLVHLSGGLIEMHFHFFVMVVVVSLYQDWVPFLASIAYVLLHHGIIGALDPRSVYNHPAAINNPWKWAAIHAFFVSGISVASIVAWRLNETLLNQRRSVEARLRDEVRVATNLSEVAKLLVADLDLTETVQRVIDAATERTSAEFGAFFYNVNDESGESYMLHALSGAPVETFARYPMPRKTDIFAPTFDGDGVVRLDDVTTDERYGNNPPHHGMPKGHLPVRSYLAVPVMSRGEVIGGMFFGHAEPARFTEIDERIVQGVASHAAAAVENAKLKEAERLTRMQEDRARKRLAIVAEASTVLSASLDMDAVLRNLGDLVVPAIADNCVVDFLESDGSLRRAHVAIEPRAAEAYERLQQRPPDPNGDDHPAMAAIRRAEPILIENITPAQVASAIGQDDYRRVVDDLQPRSAAVVPIIGPDGVLGALTLATTASSGRRLGPDDLTLAEELARRTATALVNARKYEDQREAAQTLQHSLLPESLPEIPCVELTARYNAGMRGTEVGGDWYDVVSVPNSTLGLVMGDVVGRGIAAASLMGQIRNALRAYAFAQSDPGIVLEQLNELFAEWGTIGHMATLVYGVFDIDSGELRLASAGHPPPIVRKADGTTHVIDDVRGVPLGAIYGSRYPTLSLTLDPGDTLLFYTDGLIEDRQTAFDDGLMKVRHALSASKGNLEELASLVLDTASAGRDVDDDVALLALRFVPLGDEVHLSLPTEPWVLKPLRAALRRWMREAGANEEEVFQMLVAAGEACANTMRHPGGRVRRFVLDGDRNGQIRLSVRDRGRWRESNGRTSGGRGLTLIDGFVDHLDIVKGPPETVVSMSRRLMDPGAQRG
jgi:GAF domain-containing protein/anti-sigma regulatory factor (Ser/Thr protein kinase)